jgi:hypothetical protein
MCLDRRSLRSAAAHKGWATRRRRAEGAALTDADPFEEGGICKSREARVPISRPLDAGTRNQVAEIVARVRSPRPIRRWPRWPSDS